MKTTIEDDSDQLKVPEDEIPPVRAVEAAAIVEAAAAAAAAKLLGAPTTTLQAPAPNAPRRIPGLALRAGAAAAAAAAKMTPSTKED